MDHFITRNNSKWAGVHLLIDVYNASNLSNVEYVRDTLIRAAQDTGATILGNLFYEFPGGGVTGVLALSESHISIHSWPETNYAAIDMFTCGACDPNLGLKVISERFNTKNLVVKEELRGKQNILFSNR